MGIEITESQQGRRKIFHVFGEIVGPCIVDLCKKLEGFSEEGFDDVVVDLSEMDFIDSCGLGGLIYSHRILEKNGLHLILASPRPKVRKLLTDCNFDGVIDIVDELEPPGA